MLPEWEFKTWAGVVAASLTLSVALARWWRILLRYVLLATYENPMLREQLKIAEAYADRLEAAIAKMESKTASSDGSLTKLESRPTSNPKTRRSSNGSSRQRSGSTR